MKQGKPDPCHEWQPDRCVISPHIQAKLREKTGHANYREVMHAIAECLSLNMKLRCIMRESKKEQS